MVLAVRYLNLCVLPQIYARGAEINDLCAAAVSEAASSKVPTWPGLPTGGDWQAVNRLLADALNFTHASSSKHSYTLDAAVFGGQGLDELAALTCNVAFAHY
jgi:hypothetical protein